MIFLNSSSILADIIEEHHQLIPVINRFGIQLGLGDQTIASVCNKANVNIDLFLAVLNTYLNEDYFPERKLQKIDISLIIEYLKHSDAYFIHGPLSNIEKHLNAFIAMSDPSNTQLELIRKLFLKFKNELINQIEQDVLERHVPLALLVDLKGIIIKHLSGNYNENLCYGVIFSIDSCQRDLEKHNRIREKILKPIITNLLDQGIDDWQESISNYSAPLDNSQPISQREIDVLKLIALGFLNKEIADKLGISLNTVLSHRKNIMAKLGIKTVSGLIFYCITHGYISAEEIDF